MKTKIVAFVITLTLTVNLSAQTFKALHEFGGKDGSNPESSLIYDNNALYGVTTYGGVITNAGYIDNNDGVVFRLDSDGSNFKVLRVLIQNDIVGQFDGSMPQSSLAYSGTNLFGTTTYGGTSQYIGAPTGGSGTIFRLNLDGTDFSVIKDFSEINSNTNTDGAYPEGSLLFLNDKLYGTTVNGGPFGHGALFCMSADGQTFTNLHVFLSGSFETVWHDIMLVSNTIYGIDADGGYSGGGAIYKINIDGSGYALLKSFSHTYQNTTLGLETNDDGAFPSSAIISSGSSLYGTAWKGGANGHGTIFRIDTNGSNFTVLKTFDTTYTNDFLGIRTNSDGAYPAGGLVLDGHTLYGTTMRGGNYNWGTIFAINTDGSDFNVLHSFSSLHGTNSYSWGFGYGTNRDGAYPSSSLIINNHTLYGTTTYGGSAGYGTIFSLNLLPSAPMISTQPQGQAIISGNNCLLNVVVSGMPPINYQWQFNGQNLAGATNATLTLNSVSAGDSGNYSVVVQNAYGSVTSATASLAVLTDGANGNKPVPITATPGWLRPNTVTNLVFITHGWQPREFNLLGPPAQPWMAAMTNAMAQQLGGNSTWQFETYDWTWAAWTLEPQQALSQAEYIGAELGKAIAGMGYQQVHLIAHSAGSGMIQAIADQLELSPKPPIIQLTFLDPYIGIFHQELNNYGKNADWSDCYFVEDGSGGWTAGYLPHAFNVDVSWVDPAHTAMPYFSLSGGEVALSSHGYPIDFYQQSIVNSDPNWCGADYGFALSQEMKSRFWFNNLSDYQEGKSPLLPCSPPDAVQNPTPGVAGGEAGLVGVWQVVSSIPHALSDAGASLSGSAGFALNSILSGLPLIQSGGVRPMGSQVSTNAPAWLAMGVTVSNAVNYIQFDASFTDTNAAQGLLTVYWNTNQVGMVDERVAATNLQTYRFTLPGTVTNGLYTLSFRLDSFASSSSVAVTNVATGFVGVSEPITLNISLTNGLPLLQLIGPAGYTYLVQSSTNLVDWSPTALLANTNGTVSFIDVATSNSSQRFYRAVLFSYIGAAPLLQAQVTGQSIVLSWPTSASGYALQTTTNLADPNSWVTVTNVPAIVNLQNAVTNPVSGGAQFYRLKQ